MADNVGYTEGAGKIIATDDVGGVQFQKMKLDVGGDGSSLQPAGSIPVYVVSGTGAYFMNDPFVDAVAIAGQLDDTATTAATENNIAPFRITPQRAEHVNLRRNDGIELGTATTPLITTTWISSGTVTIASMPTSVYVVSGTMAISSLPNEGQQTMANSISVAIASDQSAVPVSAVDLDIRNLVAAQDIVDLGGTALTSLQLTDDIVHATNAAINKAALMAGQFDDAATTAATEDNVAPVRITVQRAQHVNLRNVAGTELGTSITTPLIVSGTVTLGAGNINVADVDVASIIGVADTLNSTNVALGIAGIFSGTAFDTLNYPTAVIIVKSDVVSAASGLSFQWSANGLDWDVQSNTNLLANVGRGFHISHRGRYFRVVYTNGGTVQAYFRLTVIHRASTVGLISRPISDTLTADNFATQVKGIISAQKPDTTYTDIGATAAGNLKVSLEEANPTARVLVSGSVDITTHQIAVVTSVAFSNSNVTLLASNAARRMAMFYNDVDKAAYLKLGATASTSSFTVKMLPGAYYELPLPCYTGIIDALWDVSGTGSMRITELS